MTFFMNVRRSRLIAFVWLQPVSGMAVVRICAQSAVMIFTLGIQEMQAKYF